MARRQALIVGLGQFGMALARSLSAEGVEVLGVDVDPLRVQNASEIVSEAAAFDAMDEDALARTAPASRDLCVVAVGEEAREASIMVTALLRQMGAKRIIARAADSLLERILYLVGAHEVVNPERAFGERLATRLIYDGILEEIPLGDDLVITELKAPAEMIGRTLTELQLPRRYEITVLAIRRLGVEGRGAVVRPDPALPLQADDILIVVSRPEATKRLLGRGLA